MFVKIVITVLFLKTIDAVKVSQEICSIKQGEEGICTPAEKCDHNKQFAEIGEYPTLCREHGSREANVCCQYFINGTQRKNHKKGRQPGDISKQKCKEYAELVWVYREPVILLPDAPKIKVFECKIIARPLIVGGQLAHEGEFPHMALIGYLNDDDIHWDCGGTIISENYVLTAGHCTFHRGFRVKPSYVAVGFLKKQNFQGQALRVLSVITHPSYTAKALYDDIGLLKVQNMKLNYLVRPACLNTYGDVDRGNAIATGWGKMGPNTDVSDSLMKVHLNLFNNTFCNTKFEALKDGINEETQVCAGDVGEIKDTCKGDSGGPLQIGHNEKDGIRCMYDIIGITSFGKKCGIKAGEPGVYTRVSAYISWIEEIVWPEEKSENLVSNRFG